MKHSEILERAREHAQDELELTKMNMKLFESNTPEYEQLAKDKWFYEIVLSLLGGGDD